MLFFDIPSNVKVRSLCQFRRSSTISDIKIGDAYIKKTFSNACICAKCSHATCKPFFGCVNMAETK